MQAPGQQLHRQDGQVQVLVDGRWCRGEVRGTTRLPDGTTPAVPRSTSVSVVRYRDVDGDPALGLFTEREVLPLAG